MSDVIRPASEIAEALAREVRMTDDLKWRLVEASKTEKSLRSILAQAEEALEKIASGESWNGCILTARDATDIAQRALAAVREGRQ